MRSKTFVESLESRTLLSTTRVVAYYPDYRHAALAPKMDWSAVTHLNYFALGVNGSGAIGTSSSSGFNFTQLDTVVNTAHSKGVSVSIVIDPGAAWTTFMASETATTNFITQISAFCTAHNLDGIDLDFEPAWGTATPTQIANYGNLINRLNNETSNLLLSAAVNPLKVPTNPGNTTQAYVVPLSAVNSLDIINVMGYDFQIPDHAPYQQSVNSLTNWANYANGASVPKSRFTLGVPFYAHTSSSWGNVLTYQQIVDQFNPAANLDNTNGWYFNGKNTIQNKTNFVINNGYGGMMFWEAGQDHFTGNNYDASSLLPVIKTTSGLTAFTTLTAGHLVATGDANANAFSLAVSGTNLEITLGNTTRTYPLSMVNTITIDGLDGNDSVTVNSPVNKPLTFNAGNDDDSLTVTAGASVLFNATQRIESLNVAGTATVQQNGNRVLVTKSLAVAGTLDLNDNDLVLDHTGATQAAAVQTLINTARSGGTWTGLGLTSTVAKNANPKNTTLAVLESSDFQALYPGAPFNGEPIDASAVLVKFTYYGDTDFNGLVDFDDYSRTDSGFNNNRTGWLNGDFDGNGVVDFDDYSLIDQAFNTQGAARPFVLPGKSGKTKLFIR
ncbi:MAG: hypothetical protein H7Z14_20030 [Anaerolineae bacterium]|nr:hypothetical protein [Phycisphaerae bacterium]